MLLRCCIIFCAAALFVTSTGEYDYLTDSSVGRLLQLNDYINRFYLFHQSENNWKADFDALQFNITTSLRPNMTQYRENVFGNDTDAGWKTCVTLHEKELNDCVDTYLNNERECVMIANKTFAEKLENIDLLEKKIKQWREGYKEFIDVCTKNYPNDQDAFSLCLTESVKRDNPAAVTTLNHLYSTKFNAMVEVSAIRRQDQIFKDLERCLNWSYKTMQDQDENLLRIQNTCYMNYEDLEEDQKG